MGIYSTGSVSSVFLISTETGQIKLAGIAIILAIRVLGLWGVSVIRAMGRDCCRIIVIFWVLSGSLRV